MSFAVVGLFVHLLWSIMAFLYLGGSTREYLAWDDRPVIVRAAKLRTGKCGLVRIKCLKDDS